VIKLKSDVVDECESQYEIKDEY